MCIYSFIAKQGDLKKSFSMFSYIHSFYPKDTHIYKSSIHFGPCILCSNPMHHPPYPVYLFIHQISQIRAPMNAYDCAIMAALKHNLLRTSTLTLMRRERRNGDVTLKRKREGAALKWMAVRLFFILVLLVKLLNLCHFIFLCYLYAIYIVMRISK